MDCEIQTGIEPEEASRQIFARYYRLIFVFFVKRGFPTEESNDLAQETFLRIFRSMPTFDKNVSSFETWLFKVGDNVRRNALRDRSAQKRDALEVPVEDVELTAYSPLSASERGPLEDVLANERSKLLHEALEELPPQMRRCVLLRIDHDLKYREIAELMNISIDSVKAHLFQARQLLKMKLGESLFPLSQL